MARKLGKSLCVALGCASVVAWSSQAVAAGKLFAAYSFDEGAGAVVKDSSGNGFDGQVVGAAWAKGKYGNALNFNGDGNHVFIPFNAKQNVAKVTISAWVNPSGWNPELNSVAQKWDDGANKRQYQMTFYKEKDWWYVSGKGTTWPATGGATVAKIGEWTHVVGTYDGTTMKTYLNGAPAGNMAQAEGIFASDTPMLIGGYGPKTPVVYGTNRHFKGMIDDVRFYDDALTEAEAKAVMAAGLGDATAVDAAGKLATTWSAMKSR